MNYRITRMVLIAAAIVALAIPGIAQSGVVSASIPFAFTVADKTMPAGDYSITCDLSHQVVNIQSRQNDRLNALRLTTPVEDKSWCHFAQIGLQRARRTLLPRGGLERREIRDTNWRRAESRPRSPNMPPTIKSRSP